ncbi:MAG: Rossmann-like and DUF2520 domain-containing protein [bacterium]
MKTALNTNPSIGIIGAGAVGSALARSLKQAGFNLTSVIDKRAAAAKVLCEELGIQRCGTDIGQIEKGTQLVLICVPDSELSKVDAALAKHLPRLQPGMCVHTSGALPGVILETLHTLGIPTGSIHPLQTFSSVNSSPSLKGIYFALEGNEQVVELLTSLVVKLEGNPITLPQGGKALYHAAAVFASNFIPVLLREAVDLLNSAGIPLHQGREMLKPLMELSLKNCFGQGEVQALTGPVVRGDAETVQLHLDALAEQHPNKVILYRILSIKALELALEKGISAEQFENVKRVLLDK